MPLNLTDVNRVRRACEAVRDLVEIAQPRKSLCHIDRKLVANVSSRGKWLLRALGEMIHADPQLKGLLDEFAVEPKGD